MSKERDTIAEAKLREEMQAERRHRDLLFSSAVQIANAERVSDGNRKARRAAKARSR